MPAEALDKLLQATSVEIFPLLMPTKDTHFEGISVYVDDKGVAKDLDENPRMTGLVQACGHPAQPFRGDCFIGRIFDDTEDKWQRLDFTLSDCNGEAEWVNLCKKQRQNRSSGDLASLAGKVGARNPAHITPGMLEDSAPKGETDAYVWRQTDEEVEITFKRDDFLGHKKLVKVVFSRSHLKATFKEETLIDADLNGTTHADECTWTLSDGVLQVTLAKAENLSWPKLLKA